MILSRELKATDNEVPFSSWPKRLLTTSLAHLEAPGGQKWLLTLIDRGIVSAAGLFTSVRIGRTGATEKLGFYFLGLSLIGFLIEPHNAFVWFPYTAFSPRPGTDHARYSGNAFLHQWGLAVFSTPILARTGFLLSRKFSDFFNQLTGQH